LITATTRVAVIAMAPPIGEEMTSFELASSL
jgi:hypothetical protein